jgi:hypothetical protein
MSFTNNSIYKPNKEFIPMDDLLETSQFNNMTSAIKEPLYRESSYDGFPSTKRSKYDAIIVNREEVSCVSNKYELVQHQDAFVSVINALNKAGVVMQGRVNDFKTSAWLDMTFENLKVIDPAGGGDINLGYSVRNSYNKETGLNIFPFAVRGICSNGMIFKDTPDLKLDILSVRHMGDVLEKVASKIKDMLQSTLQAKNTYLEMFNKATKETFRFGCEDELIMTIASYGISEKRAKELLTRGSFNLENTSRYEIYNCLTEYATWSQLSPGLYESVQGAAEKCLSENYENTIGRIYESALKIEAK